MSNLKEHWKEELNRCLKERKKIRLEVIACNPKAPVKKLEFVSCVGCKNFKGYIDDTSGKCAHYDVITAPDLKVRICGKHEQQ